MSKSTLQKTKQGFIERAVFEGSMSQKGAWPREMKAMKQLVEKYDNEDFWAGWKPPFKLNSCCFLLNGRGAEMLEVEYKKFHIVDNYKPEDVDLSFKGEKVEVKKKPSLRNFLS